MEWQRGAPFVGGAKGIICPLSSPVMPVMFYKGYQSSGIVEYKTKKLDLQYVLQCSKHFDIMVKKKFHQFDLYVQF